MIKEDIQKILEENTAVNKEILKSVKFIKTYFVWQSAFNTIKWTLLVAVVVLGVISWRSIANSVFKLYG